MDNGLDTRLHVRQARSRSQADLRRSHPWRVNGPANLAAQPDIDFLNGLDLGIDAVGDLMAQQIVTQKDLRRRLARGLRRQRQYLTGPSSPGKGCGYQYDPTLPARLQSGHSQTGPPRHNGALCRSHQAYPYGRVPGQASGILRTTSQRRMCTWQPALTGTDEPQARPSNRHTQHNALNRPTSHWFACAPLAPDGGLHRVRPVCQSRVGRCRSPDGPVNTVRLTRSAGFSEGERTSRRLSSP